MQTTYRGRVYEGGGCRTTGKGVCVCVCVSLFGRRHGGAAHVIVNGGKPKTLQPTTTTRNTTRTAIRRTSVPLDRDGHDDDDDDDRKTTEKPQNVRPYRNAPIRTSVWGRGHGIVRVITRATISGTACLSTSPTPIVTRPKVNRVYFRAQFAWRHTGRVSAIRPRKLVRPLAMNVR